MNVWEDDAEKNAIVATGRQRLILAGFLTEACVSFSALSTLGEGFDLWRDAPQTGRAILARCRQKEHGRDSAPTAKLTHSLAGDRERRAQKLGYTSCSYHGWSRRLRPALGDPPPEVTMPRRQMPARLLRAPFEP
jgi:hypothetical protein